MIPNDIVRDFYLLKKGLYVTINAWQNDRKKISGKRANKNRTSACGGIS